MQAAAKQIHWQCDTRTSETFIKPALCYGRCNLHRNAQDETYAARVREGNVKKNGPKQGKRDWRHRRPGETDCRYKLLIIVVEIKFTTWFKYDRD